ncbi:putative lipase involved disintegration of autophagic bodies [Salirhabdus euzebyi]|uniref:Putative lipase involved disintegration of autophagic bodies n=1 Tax=Salirhabdus euzebyi TaxID=394506 RepID=A0A841Q7F9_9BACI|nr:KTSC domain-containing protein [Salirhabdus euzebyi]MBB6454361.1 putative lipase involved disintegration of autophagic bodies [Salirhabdus euzebyi]
MKKTSFNQKLWNIDLFDEIGYDKATKKLYIFCNDGKVIEFFNIEQKDVFGLIISIDKDNLITEFKERFPYNIHDNELTLSV